MQYDKCYLRLITLSSLLAVIVLAEGTRAAAQQEKVIYNSGSQSGVIFDPAGNLFGANSESIYELTPLAEALGLRRLSTLSPLTKSH